MNTKTKQSDIKSLLIFLLSILFISTVFILLIVSSNQQASVTASPSTISDNPKSLTTKTSKPATSNNKPTPTENLGQDNPPVMESQCPTGNIVISLQSASVIQSSLDYVDVTTVWQVTNESTAEVLVSRSNSYPFGAATPDGEVLGESFASYSGGDFKLSPGESKSFSGERGLIPKPSFDASSAIVVSSQYGNPSPFFGYSSRYVDVAPSCFTRVVTGNAMVSKPAY